MTTIKSNIKNISKMSSQRVEFRTFDGTILRGDLFKAKENDAPIIVMTQGVCPHGISIF